MRPEEVWRRLDALPAKTLVHYEEELAKILDEWNMCDYGGQPEEIMDAWKALRALTRWHLLPGGVDLP